MSQRGAAPGPESVKVAYLVNQYPKVSHTFIRREIAALERFGAEVVRFAVRGWDERVADPEDRAEQDRTEYLLRGGLLALVGAMLAVACTRPLRFWSALALAFRMGRRDRRRLVHAVYLAEACSLLRRMQGLGIEQLHAHFGTNGAEVAMLCRTLGGPPYSFTAHGPEEFDKVAVLGLDEKIARSNATVAISSFGRSQLWRWCDAAHWHKVHVVRCGLEAAFFGEAPAPVADTRRLLCVGRLSGQKGQLLLLEAVARLASDGVPLELVLAGDGELRPQIEAAIARHGLGGSVRITGWIGSAEVRRELVAARALVLTSFAEGLPVVLMEALAVGRPVLATWIAGIPELVRDGREGWLFEAGSVDAAVDAMRACLEAPLDRLQAMGASGRERVQRMHDVDAEAARLLAIWRVAHAGSPSSADGR